MQKPENDRTDGDGSRNRASTSSASLESLDNSVSTDAQPEPHAPAAESPPKVEPEWDLASLLAGFDAATAKKPEPAPQAPTNDHSHADGLMADFDMWQRQQSLEQQVKGLTAEVDQARHFIDNLHFGEAVNAIEERLADFGLLVPAGYVRDKILAVASQSPELVKAFDERSKIPGAYNRAMRKLQDRIIQDAKTMPDPEATGDRLAVVAAMRAASSKAPVERPPDYGSMTDREFANVLAKHNI